MSQIMTSTGSYLVNRGGANATTNGLTFEFTVTGTNSLVLSRNTAPPGAAVSLTDIAYIDGTFTAQAAGTAITATGTAYISADDAGADLYVVLTATSGSVILSVLGGQDGAYDLPLVLRTQGTNFTRPPQSGGLGAEMGVSSTIAFFQGYNPSTPAHIPVRLSGSTASIAVPSSSAQNVALIVNADGSVTQGIIKTAGLAKDDASTVTRFLKATSAISNNVATACLTITVPNAAETAVVRFTVLGTLGAGGSIGAGEASASNSYHITIVRTAGVNAVGTASSVFGAAAALVAGGATCTATAALSAVSGAVGAVNTFTVNVTVARGSGSSDNHTALVTAEVLNANATGITLS